MRSKHACPRHGFGRLWVAKKRDEQDLQREYMIAQNLACGAKLIQRARRVRARSFDLVGRSGELRTISSKRKTNAA
jgi:hypothetical protein